MIEIQMSAKQNIRAKEIAENFKRNIHSLIVFSETIGDFADKHDQEIKESIENSFMDLISSIENAIEKPSQKRTDPLNKEEDDIIKKEKNSKLKEKVLQFFIDNKKQVLASNRKYLKTPPVQGDILKRSTLISLMCILETLISQLLREFYHKYPEALPSDAKNLSLSEIRDLGSIEEAELYLIDNEIDSILRGNIQSQLACFEKPIKISLKSTEKYHDNVIELSQRRNLIIHNDGKINRHYLNKSPKQLRDDGAKEGDQINVTSAYLTAEIRSVYLVGTVLIQQCFRKWEKENIESLNDLLVNLMFDSLVDEDYEFTENLAEYAYSIDMKSDKCLRIVVINHCIALREKGMIEEMDKVLYKYDWSATSLCFELALNVLRNEEDKAYEILDRALMINEISEVEIDSWPLFSCFRTTERFSKYFDEKFPDFRHSRLEESNNIEKIENLTEGEN